MNRLSTVRVTAVIKRKGFALPRFVMLPGQAFAGWNLEGTTVVDTTIEGEVVGR